MIDPDTIDATEPIALEQTLKALGYIFEVASNLLDVPGIPFRVQDELKKISAMANQFWRPE